LRVKEKEREASSLLKVGKEGERNIMEKGSVGSSRSSDGIKTNYFLGRVLGKKKKHTRGKRAGLDTSTQRRIIRDSTQSLW